MKLNIFKRDDDIDFKVKASPIFWRQKAEEQKYASELIWPHAMVWLDKIKPDSDLSKLEPDTFSIYLSLIGFSTECLFKASIIKNNPSFVSNGKLSRKLKSHNLIDLANIADIELTQNEQIFCKQAFKAMIVDSRYPVALESESINGITEIGGNCKEVFDTLYDKLYPTLGQINK